MLSTKNSLPFIQELLRSGLGSLCSEQKRRPARGLFELSICTETAIGIVREHLLLLMEGDVMKGILAKPASAAIISLILSLPLGLTFVAFMFDIEPLVKPLNNLFMIKGRQGEINMLGRIVIYGGLLLLPVAFVLNLRPMLRREGTEGKRKVYALNLIIAVGILLLITFTWGGLLLEEIYCLRGIRCD